jgi:hypothetical protein
MTAEELAEIKAEVARLREDLDLLLDEGVPGRGYQPIPSPRWWLLRDEARTEAVARLAAWVEQVYRPMYGQLAATLPACWADHPLCLVCLDWLSELHSVLYLQPSRSKALLGGQAEWHTRFLPAVADLMTAEGRGCEHKRARLGAIDLTQPTQRGARA